jgi:RNA polymerase sigma-70 factor (ECF subfamily)
MAATSAASGATAERDRLGTADEARLARAAAAGDGAAFATLYDRYESRIFNFCHRLLGSRDDAADATQDAFLNVLRRLPELEGRELNFSAYLFTAARNASYDLIGKRRRAVPTDQVPEPTRAQEPGELDRDPERAAMLTSLQADVREANGRLPERQREVLALRELEELSYDEIAEIMEMNRNAVAQLISRARIKLRDELRGTALASIAVSSPDCERALALIAVRQDRQLDDAGDRAWLAEHLADCDTCRVAQEAIQEAGISYRAWLPILPAAWLWQATAAKAAELVGADWSHLVREHRQPGAGNGAAAAGGQGPVTGAVAAAMTVPSRQDDPVESVDEAAQRRRVVGGGLLALILLLGFSTAVAIGTDRAPRRQFATTGGVSFSLAPPAAAAAGAKAGAGKKPKKAASPYGTSTSTPNSTGDENASSGTTTGDTPRRLARHQPSGNSVGGEENGSTSTPTTSTPSTPATPDTPPPPVGGTPSGDGGPSGGGTPPTPSGPSTGPAPGAGPPPRR